MFRKSFSHPGLCLNGPELRGSVRVLLLSPVRPAELIELAIPHRKGKREWSRIHWSNSEVWAYEFREPLSMPLLAVGAAFNFHAGQLPQAPGFLQDRGLEWAFRLAKEPRRLWRRYLYLSPLYLLMIAAQSLGIRQFDPHSGRPPNGQRLYG